MAFGAASVSNIEGIVAFAQAILQLLKRHQDGEDVTKDIDQLQRDVKALLNKELELAKQATPNTGSAPKTDSGSSSSDQKK